MNVLRRLLGKSDIEYSAQTAKTRLTTAIAQDRSECSAATLDMIKQTVVEAVSKHVEVDDECVRLSIAREGETNYVVANIPIVNGRRLRNQSRRESIVRRGTCTTRAVLSANAK